MTFFFPLIAVCFRGPLQVSRMFRELGPGIGSLDRELGVWAGVCRNDQLTKV